MKTIGLVGGIASGKSAVAKLLAEQGAGVLDADRAGHAVLAKDMAIRQAIRERWGDGVFKSDGTVDRNAIANRVFGTSAAAVAERHFLESLMHPKIGELLQTQLDQLAAAGCKVVVLDAALMFEAGWNTFCDFVVFVDAPRETRFARAAARGWSEAQFASREASQWPVERKRSAADFVLENNGSLADLRQAIAQFWRQHVAPAAEN